MKKLCFLLFSLTTLSPTLATQNITFAQCVGFLSLMLSNSWEKKMQGQEEDLIDDIKALEALNEKTQDLIKQAKHRKKDLKRLKVSNLNTFNNVETIQSDDLTERNKEGSKHCSTRNKCNKRSYDSDSDSQEYDIMGWNKDYTKNCYTGTQYNIEGWTWCGTKHKDTGTMFGPRGWNYSKTIFIPDTENEDIDDEYNPRR